MVGERTTSSYTASLLIWRAASVKCKLKYGCVNEHSFAIRNVLQPWFYPLPTITSDNTNLLSVLTCTHNTVYVPPRLTMLRHMMTEHIPQLHCLCKK